jgi:regulator of protease activity HflC (stomatin/prohibitin superfamily)
LLGVGVAVVIALIGGVLAYEQVPEGHEGVTTEWGAVTGETLDPGAHFKIPVMQNVQAVETRPRTYTMSNTAGQQIILDASNATRTTGNETGN